VIKKYRCRECGHYMGEIDDEKDLYPQQSALFFSGLGRWRIDNHEPTCSIVVKNPTVGVGIDEVA
jgi:hypothetical protein